VLQTECESDHTCMTEWRRWLSEADRLRCKCNGPHAWPQGHRRARRAARGLIPFDELASEVKLAVGAMLARVRDSEAARTLSSAFETRAQNTRGQLVTVNPGLDEVFFSFKSIPALCSSPRQRTTMSS
jgi:hypothetical protein